MNQMEVNMKDPESLGRKQDGTFMPGVSGNPSGRPKGAYSKTTRIVQNLLAEEAEEVARVVLEAAKGGDLTAAKLVLDKLVPAAKDAPVSEPVDLPELTAEGLPKAVEMIVQSVACGKLLPGEGQALIGMLEGLRKSLEFAELEKRIAALEGQGGGK
jgi:hypothetical protein